VNWKSATRSAAGYATRRSARSVRSQDVAAGASARERITSPNRTSALHRAEANRHRVSRQRLIHHRLAAYGYPRRGRRPARQRPPTAPRDDLATRA
jgi:hypothetical protein